MYIFCPFYETAPLTIHLANESFNLLHVHGDLNCAYLEGKPDRSISEGGLGPLQDYLALVTRYRQLLYVLP